MILVNNCSSVNESRMNDSLPSDLFACDGNAHTGQRTSDEAGRNLAASMILLAITVFGLTSNILTLVILRRDSKLRTSSGMSVLLAALAATDLLYLIALTMAYTYVKLVDSLLNLGLAAYGSGHHCTVGNVGNSLFFPCQMAESWLILSLTIDRFFAVCYPFRFRRLCTARNARLAVIAIYAAAITLHVITYMHAVHLIFHLEQFSMAFLYINWAVLMIIGNFVPLVLLTVFNIILMYHLRAFKKRQSMTASFLLRKQRESADDQPAERRGSPDRSAHIVAVVVVFWICQAPFLFQYFLFLLQISQNESEAEPEEASNAIQFVVKDDYLNVMNVLMTINSTINFILYCLFYERFRNLAGKMLFPSAPEVCN